MWHILNPATLIKFYLGTIMILMAGYMFFYIAPQLETMYWPVLDKLQIIEVRPIDPDTSIVMTAFKKRRDCAYLGTAWYRSNSNGSFERVAMVTERVKGDDSSPNRPLGYQTSGPWRVSMPAEQIRSRSIVEIFHQCWPFWTTRTQFYP